MVTYIWQYDLSYILNYKVKFKAYTRIWDKIGVVVERHSLRLNYRIIPWNISVIY